MTHAELGIIAGKLALHWIPISDKPPEDDSCYFQLSYGEKGYTGYAIGYRAGGHWWCPFSGKLITAKILAYMPLPEAYKP